VLKGGIFVDPSKVQDVLSWNAPTSVNDIQNSLELARYYWRFIEGFSKISKPMTELLKKDKNFKRTLTCEAYFQEFKKRLTTAPILVMPNMDLEGHSLLKALNEKYLKHYYPSMWQDQKEDYRVKEN
jgi:hypothetical protein